MVVKKPRIVIIGAGMSGLAAANRLHSSAGESISLSVVEGGSRLGGRINTSEFCGDRIELGATWIHGIAGSPVHDIARRSGSLLSPLPWEGMHGSSTPPPTTLAEGGSEPDPRLVSSITALFHHLMALAQGHQGQGHDHESCRNRNNNNSFCFCTHPLLLSSQELSIGAFLRRGLQAYWGHQKNDDANDDDDYKVLEEAVFAMHENIQRTYTSAGDLTTLDYKAESEYRMFAGEEITIAKGYISVIESLASILPEGMVQLGKKVTKIEWQRKKAHHDDHDGPVRVYFSDGSVMVADHVIVTVSLGVLKAGTRTTDCCPGSGSGLFEPELPEFKTEAIKKLGFGTVNKLFLELQSPNPFPFLQMAFLRPESGLRDKKIPPWMRRTATLSPIYNNSKVLLSWFAGEEALSLELLKDKDIVDGVAATVSSFLPKTHFANGSQTRFGRVLRSQWGRDPLFMGSYSYVAVGSSGDDLDKMAEPLVELKVLFAGEATHRTHYSTTHGAYLSGLREANRLLQFYGIGHYSDHVGV